MLMRKGTWKCKCGRMNFPNSVKCDRCDELRPRKARIILYYQIVDMYGVTITDAHTRKQALKIKKDWEDGLFT